MEVARENSEIRLAILESSSGSAAHRFDARKHKPRTRGRARSFIPASEGRITVMTLSPTDAEAWTITPKHQAQSIRWWNAQPTERMVVDFTTYERYHGKIIKSVYPAEVQHATISHVWMEREDHWKTEIRFDVVLLNPRTMERYSPRNPKNQLFQARQDTIDGQEAIEKLLADLTRPNTRLVITIEEVPVHA